MPTITLLVFGGLCASACHGSDETFEVSGDNIVFRGEGSIAALSAEEAATYQADMAYVHSLMPAGAKATLNHADDRQHRFVLARLKMAGKTPANSPEFFKGIEDLRVKQIAQGLKSKNGVAAIQAETNVSTTETIQDNHSLVALDIVNVDTQLKVAARASVHQTLTHGYVDTAPWDNNGTQIGNLQFVEVFAPMPYASPVAIGNLSQTTLDTVMGDSLLVEDSVANGHQEFYTFQARPRKNLLDPPVLIGPVDVNNDGCINVCINRSNTDCDYNLVSNTFDDFRLPIQGNVSIANNFFTQGVRIDTNRVAQYAAGTATDNSVPPQLDPGGNLTVTLTNTGGGCSSTNPSNTLTLPERLFWQTVTVTNGGQTLNWNMTGANLADFGVACAITQDHVELDISVEVPTVDNKGNTGIVPLFISNGVNSQPSQPPLSSCFHVIDAAGTAAACPALGADTECGTVITITPTAAKIANTPGQGPYDQIEDSLVGVVNNSNQPIRAMQVRSAVPIFAFDGDGVCGTNPNTGLPFNPRPPGCPFGPTGYEGPGVTFSDMSADRRTGTINFNPPITTGGGTAYFTLEENIQNVCSCADVLNKSVPRPTLGSPLSLDGLNTSLTASFTPQCGGSGGNPPTLRDAAFFCGFDEFNWQQTFTAAPPPVPVCPAGSTVTVSAPPPFNDPAPTGWSYQNPPNAVVLPVYYNLFTGASDPLSLAANEQPTNNLSSTSLSYFDAPADPCLPGQQDSGTAAAADAICGAPCGSTLTGAHNRAPAGSKLAVTTHLVGIIGALPGALVQDTGIGFTWTSSFDGTTGGIAVLNSFQPVDPNSGSGGVTITSFHDTTTYDYNGIVVTTVNGSPIGGGGDTTPPVVTASANPTTLWPPNGKMVPVTISGTITDSEPGASGVNPDTVTFAVADEYGAVQPSGSVTVGASGAYSAVIPLQASRNGSDRDGRLYSVTIAAQDNAGNPASVVIQIIVPHDQGH